MGDENKEDILANFQSITGIEDVGEAFTRLEEANWNLMQAISTVIPQPADCSAFSFPPETQNSFEVKQNNVDGNREQGPSRDRSFTRWDHPSTSANITDAEITDLTLDMDIDPSKKNNSTSIKFSIHYNQKIHCISLPSTATIGNLKSTLHRLTHVPVCRQLIQGWPPENIRQANESSTVLSELNLNPENELILTDMSLEGFAETNDKNGEGRSIQSTSYTLHIKILPEHKEVTLKVDAQDTVLDIKHKFFYISNIAVRHQEWIGWPNGVTNSTKLGDSGITDNHKLSVQSNSNKPNRFDKTINLESDSSADEYEDAAEFNADDEFFSDSPPVRRSQSKYLIPDNTDDEQLGSIQFVENYMEKFGEPYPTFTQGSLEDVLKAACFKPAKERKLLAIYLHHGDSILTNVFCDNILKNEGVRQTFEQNFLLFGWDLTFESNKNLFLSSITACVGNTASITVRNMSIDKLPAILIIGKTRVFGRSACEVLFVIHGNVGIDDFLSRLMESVEVYSTHIRDEIQEENERAARDQVKIEQDIAYQETLQIDMAKEEAKQQKERALAAERHRLESEKAEMEAQKEILRLEAENQLPIEPASSITIGVTNIRVRDPNGGTVQRRFFASDQLKDLLNFVASKGFLISHYKVISSWPRRDLTTLNKNDTLEQLKLCPQETVTVEER